MVKEYELMLAEIRQLNLSFDKMNTKLYGEENFEGDITEIKDRLKKINGKSRGNEIRSKVNQALLIFFLSSSSIAGVTKILEVW